MKTLIGWAMCITLALLWQFYKKDSKVAAIYVAASLIIVTLGDI